MKYIDQMITDQIRIWSQHQQDARLGGEAPGAWPIITISRAFGAHGAALANVLGRRIGFKVWDKDLLQAVAAESGGDERLLASLDEHWRQSIDDAVQGTLRGSQHTNVQYFRALLRVVHTIATHGKSIVVGRGANYICSSSEILRVRVVRPLEARIHDYARREGLDEKQARKRVTEVDTERADFVRHNFKQDSTEASDYDLVLNAETYALEVLADIVLAAYEAKVGKSLPVVG